MIYKNIKQFNKLKKLQPRSITFETSEKTTQINLGCFLFYNVNILKSEQL